MLSAWKVEGTGGPGDPNISRRVQLNARSRFISHAAEVRGKLQCLSIRFEFGQEGVGRERSTGVDQISPGGREGHLNVAGGHRGGPSLAIIVAAIRTGQDDVRISRI